MVAHYEIRVQGRLDPHWSHWFNGWTMTAAEEDQTLLHGPVADQAALHGLLERVRDLGLVLVAVQRVNDQKPGF